MGIAKKVKKQHSFPFVKVTLFSLLLFLTLFRPFAIIYQQKEAFLTRDYFERYGTFKKLYYSSQYVKKDKPSIIPDEILESFAGGAFLQGLNPILIIHDQPPLGRYIIALSILLFANAATIIVPLLLLSLVGMYLISYKVIENVTYALIPVALFSNEPLFMNKFIYNPLLEPIQLPFIIFALYFFILGIEKKKPLKWFILSSIMLGFVISIRFFVLGAGVVVAMSIFFLLRKKIDKKMITFFISLPLSLVILIVSYTKTIQAGYSLIQVLGIQKYLLVYHKSKFILPFSFWDLLLFNRWHTWWGDKAIIGDPHWIILWPVVSLVTFIGVILWIMKKIVISSPEKIILLWVAVLSFMLSTGYTSTRYFLPLLPFLYILATSFIIKVVKQKNLLPYEKK